MDTYGRNRFKRQNFYTFVNGVLVFENGKVLIEPIGQQLMFKR
jgi:hypothetical protein